MLRIFPIMEKNACSQSILTLWILILCSFVATPVTAASQILEIDDTCSISILNRKMHVDFSVNLNVPNVPVTPAMIRAHANCVRIVKTSSCSSYPKILQGSSNL